MSSFFNRRLLLCKLSLLSLPLAHEYVLHELVEVVEFLKDPRKFAELGARIPKGVLLEGPPGTGKSQTITNIIAEAIADGKMLDCEIVKNVGIIDEELLEKDGFDRVVYMNMRKELYEAIEWVFDVDLRHKLRNSWYSYGKAMDKKVPRN